MADKKKPPGNTTIHLSLTGESYLAQSRFEGTVDDLEFAFALLIDAFKRTLKNRGMSDDDVEKAIDFALKFAKKHEKLFDKETTQLSPDPDDPEWE